MQASKIRIDDEYALQQGDQLVRFVVTKIVTTRVNNGVAPPSQVFGYIPDDSKTFKGFGQRTNKLGELGPFSPDLIKGSYKEYTELVEQKQRETAERHAKDAADKAEQDAAVAVLASVMPAGLREHVKRSYDGGASIGSREALVALAGLLRERGLAPAADVVVPLFPKEKTDA